MTWPDTFVVDGKWDEGFLENAENHIHPKVQAAIDQRRCIGTFEEYIPFSLHDCEDGGLYCMPCVLRGCHGCDLSFEEIWWSFRPFPELLGLCLCLEDDCKVTVKKRKTEGEEEQPE
eukprot:TRINITY_DN11682_c0_g1_i1.p1 TRINITY_DN11682_c0_g1~~TRINITY_DN11682_c0_g1_i1.p1  ORF type:complete len:117 (-),score=23.79 TRINITY_DN11682_c0_g1_i1:68-418(-)